MNNQIETIAKEEMKKREHVQSSGATIITNGSYALKELNIKVEKKSYLVKIGYSNRTGCFPNYINSKPYIKEICKS